MTTIVLVRHGHVAGISPPRFRGRHPLSLSEQGYQEATRTAARIRSTWRPAIVLTSPLERCVVTAAAIASACHVRASVAEGLIDLDYGQWQWKTHEEIGRSCPVQYRLWQTAPQLVRFPSGDSLQDIVLRSADVLRYAVEAFPGQTVVLVGHDSVNRALLLQLLDQPLSAYWKLAQDPCCINVAECDDGAVRIQAINDTRHIARATPQPDGRRL
jgi:probable phosphoglycerate mutase